MEKFCESILLSFVRGIFSSLAIVRLSNRLISLKCAIVTVRTRRQRMRFSAKADAMAKLAPRALWWFRWGALITFLTGAYLFHKLGAFGVAMPAIWMGALAGTLMFLNVWLIIWPKQQIVLGMKEGDGPAAAAKAGLASRTNTLLSGPMLLGMLGSGKLALGGTDTGLYAAMGLIVILEANALFGGQGPMKSVIGVIHCSLALSLVIWGLLNYV